MSWTGASIEKFETNARAPGAFETKGVVVAGLVVRMVVVAGCCCMFSIPNASGFHVQVFRSFI